MKATGKRTVLFIDEIHRFNKAQQDVLLPDVEAGSVRLIGATTHNPSFYINGPLVSRSQIFQLEPLSSAPSFRSSSTPRWPIRSAGWASSKSSSRPRQAHASHLHVGRRCPPRAQRTRDRRAHHAARCKRHRAHRHHRRWKNACRKSASFTTRTRTSITTPSPPSSNRCAGAIPTPRSTGWRRWSRPARTRASSRAG